MHTTMTLDQQLESAAALQSMLATGTPVADAAARLVRLQPAYAQFWADVATKMRVGAPLSAQLGAVWPAGSVAAVRAGETSGKLADVLGRLVEAIELRQRLADIAGKLRYPLGIAGAGVLAFVGMMLTVVPSIAKSMQHAAGRTGQLAGIAGVGLRAQELLLEHWLMAALAIGIAAVALVGWARSAKTRDELYRLLLASPKFGPALRHLSFGLWADYLALACDAGIPTVEALATTEDVLPASLRDGVRGLAHDLKVRHLALGVAVDPDRQQPNDQRAQWPFNLYQAFSVGEETGDLAKELRRAAPTLVKIGERQLNSAIEIANKVAIVFAGSLLASTFLLIYLPMLASLKNLR